MKVSILTFAKGDNYGAVLQAYALKKVLQRLGYESEFISYTWTPIRYAITSRITPLRRNFNQFRNKYMGSFSLPCTTESDLKKAVSDTDVCIVGSDQVWNQDITQFRWPFFYFSFVTDEIPKISYAASFGKEKWDWDESTKQVKDYLSKFDYVSVRESSAVDICRDTFDIESKIVVDPTLLLSNFNEIMQTPKHKGKVVGFMFHPSKSYYSLLKYIGNKLEKKILVMDLPSRETSLGVLKFKISPYTKVDDWVTNIANSSFVVTDSFHCLAFSIIHNREFIFIASIKKLAGRVRSLLSQLGIEGRIFDNPEDAQVHYNELIPINYQSVNERLSALRADSLSFLKNALDECSRSLLRK